MDDVHRIRLAEGPICMVEACQCGVLHLTIGPVTLRLQAEAVESLWVTLGEAIRRHAAHEHAAEVHHTHDKTHMTPEEVRSLRTRLGLPPDPRSDERPS